MALLHRREGRRHRSGRGDRRGSRPCRPRRRHRRQQVGSGATARSATSRRRLTTNCGGRCAFSTTRRSSTSRRSPANGRPRCSKPSTRSPQSRRKRVPTPALNKFIEAVTAANPPVSPGRRHVRIMYVAQVGVAPPSFVFFTNVATTFHFSYERFLINQIREHFGFVGTPIRIQVRRRARSRSRHVKSGSLVPYNWLISGSGLSLCAIRSARGTHELGRIGVRADRTLPSPSPSANPVGVTRELLVEAPVVVRRRTRSRRRRHHRSSFLHLILAGRRDRPERSRVDGVLCRRHRRAGDRQVGAVVRARRDAVLLRRARALHRELGDVRPRRRVPRRQGGDGRHARQAVGLGAAVRLRPDRPDQRRVRRPLHRRPGERPARARRRSRFICRTASSRRSSRS